MSVSRRSFVRTLGVGSAGALALPWVSARGMEASSVGEGAATVSDRWQNGIIKLDSNENPNGPVPAAIEAIKQSFHRAALYPAAGEGELRTAIAKANGVPAEMVMLGCGSGELLRLSVQAYCSPTKPLVAANPTFESSGAFARTLGYPERAVPLAADLSIDLNAMLAQVKGAGLVFLCNPNNPTGHVHGAAAVTAFVEAALAADPDVIVMVDEAYHEFVDDPSYATALPLVEKHARVVVSRTYSKIYGLAGLRVGYLFGQPATIAKMQRFRLPNGINGLAQVAVMAAISDPAQMRREQELNRIAKRYTRNAFEKAGFKVVPSEANFILVDVKRESRLFREACRTKGVAVGRPFPPLTNWARISIGTMAEMEKACPVMLQTLA